MNSPGRPALPARASDRIARSLDAAHLRRRDREDVAEELAAHLEDGLACGRELEELLEDFGEPARAGALIGRSVRRRRRARQPLLRALKLLMLSFAIVYGEIFARLHVRAPERPFATPSAAAAAWTNASWQSERDAFETVLASMYTAGDEGRLTATGLRAFQSWKGKTVPGVWSVLLEPAYFPNPARRGEVQREFERFLALAQEDVTGRAFEQEREALLSDRRRSLRYVALQIPLDRLAAARAARRTP